MAEVAVLGAGRMGSAMVRRVAAAGHAVRVWNRSPAAAALLAGSTEGVRAAATPSEAARGADVVLSVLADGDATCAVLLDAGLLKALSDSAVVVDLGTSGVAAARALAEGLSRAGARFVDGPVSGSVPSVEAGTLLVMAGGSDDAVVAARPVLSAFADRVVTVGPPGAGQAMKLAVNLVVHDLDAAVSEALRLAEASGIRRDDAYGVLESSVVGAPFVRYKRPAFVSEDAPVAMSLALMLKDLGLICDQAAAVGEAVPVTERVRARVSQAVEAGWGARDMADLSRWNGPV